MAVVCIDCQRELWVRERQHLYIDGWRCHLCHEVYCNKMVFEDVRRMNVAHKAFEEEQKSHVS